jgi:hypothetical protein
MYKEFTTPGQTVNGSFYCDVLRWMRENIQSRHPVMYHNNSWALHLDSLLTYMLSCHQNAGQNWEIKIVNRSFEMCHSSNIGEQL